MSARTHPEAVAAAYERILRGSKAHPRFIEVADGRRVHIIESGEGPPVVLLHGTATSSLFMLPLVERLTGVRAIAVDRPGFGLSDPQDLPHERFREAAVEHLGRVLDALGLDAPALVGSSMGGTWALWYALAHPERVGRVVLLGAPPSVPGTRVPPPLRVMSTPKLGEFLDRVTKPSPTMIVRMYASMGERETIVGYPEQIDALVAAGSDSIASAATLTDLRALISPFGFRRPRRLRREDLRGLAVPTLVLWGDHDPVGSVKVATATASAIPGAHLELLPTGHVPWLGHPDRTAALVSDFVR